MLVYEKLVDGVRKLFGTTANIPAVGDSQLVYKDIDGDVITPVTGDTYLDDGAGGIVRKSDGKFVGVFIGSAEKAIIPKDWQPEAKVLSSIAITKKPTKTTYVKSTAFATAGMKVTATYTSGDKEQIALDNEGLSTSPANGANVQATAGEQTVTVTYVENEVTKTATFKITVTNE